MEGLRDGPWPANDGAAHLPPRTAGGKQRAGQRHSTVVGMLWKLTELSDDRGSCVFHGAAELSPRALLRYPIVPAPAHAMAHLAECIRLLDGLGCQAE